MKTTKGVESSKSPVAWQYTTVSRICTMLLSAALSVSCAPGPNTRIATSEPADGISRSASGYTFSATQKDASSFTSKANQSVYAELPFDDKKDFERVDKGFIAPLLDQGNIDGVFSSTRLNFMQNKEAPPTVNPSLWRHAQLVNRGGLYQVTDHIYQVRGQDLVNLTIIEGATGIILYDIEYTPATLKKSIQLYEQQRGKKPLKGVIISHSHADHFGGFDGIYDAGLAKKEDITSGKIPFYAPVGFVEKSVSENVMAGNIMARRAGYQYGNVLQPNEKGIITASLGAALANGNSGLPIPNKLITQDGQKVRIDGVEFVFYLTPEAEAPAEMVFYIPQWKALSMAEEVNHLQHNIYTLRGAEIRDAGRWASYIADALARFGDEVEVHFGPHTWPVWGNADVVQYLQDQRDLYQTLHDTVLRYANHGYRPDDIAESAKLPEKVMKSWTNRPYYGHTRVNLKSTYVRNLGWFSGNGAELARYPDAERGKRYVEAIGGVDRVLEIALASFEKGDYRFVLDLLNNVVAYDGSQQKINFLMADAFEQLGYQEENSLVRNLYLSAANELRVGGNVKNDLNTASPEVIASLPPELFMAYLAMTLDPVKAEKAGNATINLKLGANAQFAVDLHNGVLSSVKGHRMKRADAALEIAQPDLLSFVLGKDSLDNLIQKRGAKVEGDRGALQKLVRLFDTDIKNDMNLVLPLQDANKVH